MQRTLLLSYSICEILRDLLKTLRFCEDFSKNEKVLLTNSFIGDGAG